MRVNPWVFLPILVLAVATASVHAAAPLDAPWYEQAGNAAGTRFNAAEHALGPRGLRVLWQTTLSQVTPSQPPVVGLGRVFEFRQEPGARLPFPAAYDVRSGRLLRTYPGVMASVVFPGELAYNSGSLYVTGTRLVAVDVASGRVLWRTTFGSGRLGVHFPIISGRTVLLRLTKSFRQIDFPVAVDAVTGRILWSAPKSAAESMAVYNDRVTVHYSGLGSRSLNEVLETYDLRTGRRLWSTTLPINIVSENWMYVQGRLVGSVPFASGFGTLAYTIAGRPAWRERHFRLLAAAGGTLYGLYVVHPPTTDARPNPSPAYAAALDALTGRVRWIDRSVTYSADRAASAAVANGVVYLPTVTGTRIYAFDAASGKIRSAIALPSDYWYPSAVEVGDGQLFVLATKGSKPRLGAPATLFAYGS